MNAPRLTQRQLHPASLQSAAAALAVSLMALCSCDRGATLPAGATVPGTPPPAGSTTPEAKAARLDFASRSLRRRDEILREWKSTHTRKTGSDNPGYQMLEQQLLLQEAMDASEWEAKNWSGYEPGQTIVLPETTLLEVLRRSGMDPPAYPFPQSP